MTNQPSQSWAFTTVQAHEGHEYLADVYSPPKADWLVGVKVKVNHVAPNEWPPSYTILDEHEPQDSGNIILYKDLTCQEADQEELLKNQPQTQRNLLQHIWQKIVAYRDVD